MKFAVIGGGSGGQAIAADLALGGYETRLYETDEYKDYIEPLVKAGGIEYYGMPSNPGRSGFADISVITTNIKEAIEGVDVIHVCVPAYRHEKIIELMAPHLEDGQVVMFQPDNWGSLRLRKYLLEHNINTNVIPVAIELLLYNCRRVSPTRVFVRRVKENLRYSGLEEEHTKKAGKILDEIWPKRCIPEDNFMEVVLYNRSWVSHPSFMLFNAARIESDKGMFLFVKEGGISSSFGVMSPSKLTGKLTDELLQVLKAWGFKTKYPENYPPGNKSMPITSEEIEKCLQIEIPGVLEPSPDHSPSTLDHRYITEEIPYGLVPLHHLAKLVGVSTPYVDATVNLCGLLVDKNYWEEGLTLDKLGWQGLSAIEILKKENIF